jgi:hypothetical protein
VLEHAFDVLSSPKPPHRQPKFWDGQAAARILDSLETVL